MNRLVPAIALALWSITALGDEVRYASGNSLLEWCTGDVESADYARCQGMVVGVIESYFILTTQTEPEERICLPKNDATRRTETTVGQLTRVVQKYLEDHPEKLHRTASGLVINALAEAFPCYLYQ